MISVYKTVQSFAQFLNNWLLKGGKLVDQATANARAEICVQCHNCVPSSEVRKSCCGGGAAANTAIAVARKLIIQNKTTPSDKKLLTCGLCGCDLKIKVWIPINALGIEKQDANAYPTHCWLKKVVEDKEV